GFTGHWRHWKPVLADLVAGYEVIAPTLSGHNGGPPYPRGVGLEKVADAGDSLERHLDELGVGTAHFVGNSMGGALALELAKRGRARSVVAISPGGGWELSGPEPAAPAGACVRALEGRAPNGEFPVHAGHGARAEVDATRPGRKADHRLGGDALATPVAADLSLAGESAS